MKDTLVIILSLVFLSTGISAKENSVADLQNYLQKLDHKVKSKWEKYIGWQHNSEWVQNTVDMGLSGEIYSKGWMSPQVSRQIVPDLAHGWLVVDTVTLGQGLLLSAATLSANILINQVFPYIQAGPIKNKTFVDVRKVDTYEEAVMAAPFNVSKLPIAHDQFSSLKEEEQISTLSTGGMFIRAGGGIANLIGLELPANINIGPKSKITFEGSLKLTVAKEKNDHVLISVEKIKKMTNGIGLGFGLFFEDIIDIPVTIGINSSNGYFPFLFNMKDSKSTTSSVVYDLDLSTAKGKEAYRSFLTRDFAHIEVIAEEHSDAVVIDMQKEGQVKSHETNAMVNLVVWRSGFRNIFVEGKFNTTDRAGNRFEYFELESEQIKDKKWFSNIEKTDMKYMALVPSSKHENGELIKQSGGFLLDTHFFYEDTKTKGKEIQEISNFLMDSGTQLRLPFKVNKKHNYEHVQIDVKVRIQTEDMAQFLKASPRDIWFAIAYAQGIYDPYVYENQSARDQFIKNGQQGSEEDRTALLDAAKKVILEIKDISEQKTLKDKARKMMDDLKDGKAGQLLFKTLLEFVGKNKVMVRGFVRGKLI